MTTLRDRHVRIEGSTLRMRFTGKSAKIHEVSKDLSARGSRELAADERRFLRFLSSL